MILKGNQRGGARDLALHLEKDDNDHVHIHEIRGFVANDLLGAFRETQALSKGTKCKQYLYSLSLNPPKGEEVSTKAFEKAIEQAENRLALNGQPRAVVFHEKDGRRHAHVVWSRIDVSKMKAVQLSNSKRKLNALSKQLYLDHGWRLPAGHVDKSLSNSSNFTLADWQQAKRNGQDPRKIKEAIQTAWHDTHSADDFETALGRAGFKLAQGGRRNVVVVDRFGEIRSLARQLKVKAKDVNLRIGDTLTLKPVDDVQRIVKSQLASNLTKLVGDLDSKGKALKDAYKQQLNTLRERQRAERKSQFIGHKERAKAEVIERQSRFRKGLKGAWDVLRGEHYRISQKNKLEAAIAKYRDIQEQEALIKKHLTERQALSLDRAKAIEQAKALQKQRIEIEAEIKQWNLPEKKKQNQQRKRKGLSL